jgi:wyosine [tRNA(Phe)-imidazoG37] synthetase (radical SAM superfamily)
VPALSGQSPLEAVKTPDGKKKVEKLLEGLETMQDKNPDEAFRIDIKGLRVRLGI